MKCKILLLMSCIILLASCEEEKKSYNIPQWHDPNSVFGYAKVNESWVENVIQNGENGINIHIAFDVKNMKNKNGEVRVHFESPKGEPIDNKNGRFKNMLGHSCNTKDFQTEYESAEYKDFVIFMPLSEIHINNGNKDYYCKIDIYNVDDKQSISNDYYVSLKGLDISNKTADNTNIVTDKPKAKTNIKKPSQNNNANYNTVVYPNGASSNSYSDYSGSSTSSHSEPYQSTVKSKRKCPSCRAGECTRCGGSGYIDVWGLDTKTKEICDVCHGSKLCRVCYGKNYID